MSGVRVVLDGIVLPPSDVEGDDAIKVSWSAVTGDNSGGPLKRAPGTLTFYGDAWELIKVQLIDHPEGKNRTLPILIFDVCAGQSDFLLFEGVVRGDLLRWCDGECSVQADCVEDTVETRKMDCLRSTFVWDDRNGFQTQAHPRMVYCDELRPEWLQWIVLSLSVLLLLIFLILYPLAVVILSIVDFLNTLGANIDFDGDPSTTNLGWWQNLNQEIANRCIGCGRRHPSPLVRSYVQNVCDICDVSFSSSIFNSPTSDYYNTVYLNADAKKGIRANDPVGYIIENRPNKTLDVFLDAVAAPFNAMWRLENSTIRLERRDKLKGNVMWIDTEQLRTEKRVISGVCYTWEKEDKPAYLEIGYLPDGLDITSNEAGDRYSEDVNWNDPFFGVQKGIRTEQFMFGAARFRNDGVEEDVLSQFTWYPPLAGAIQDHDHALLLSKGIAGNPKLLLWDGVSTDFGVVRQYNVPGWPVVDDYNWPLQLNEHNVTPHTAYPTTQANMALYGRFWAIEDPRVIEGKGYTFELEFEYSRDHLATLDLWKYVQLPYGKGDIHEVTVNPEGKTIFVSGVV